MKSFLELASKRKTYHQELILRSLEKDREAYKQLQRTQHTEDIDSKSPVQFIVKNLRIYLESIDNLSSFQARVYRLISRSELPGSDSEEGLQMSDKLELSDDSSQSARSYFSQQEDQNDNEQSVTMSPSSKSNNKSDYKYNEEPKRSNICIFV